MIKFSILVVFLVINYHQVGDCAPDNLIRVSLDKSNQAQAGDLGEPVTSYYATIYVGTPPKAFKLLIDINARETWIPHYLTLGILYQRLNYRNGYNKKSSSTSEKENQEYTINYNQQVELMGKAYKDFFEFKDVLESLLPAKFKQRFLAISSANNDKFNKFNVDGVLALNPFTISETGSDLPLISINRANLTRELKFSLLLDGQSSATDGVTSGGELAFGKVENTSKYIGTPRYHQTKGQHKWELNLQSVLLGGDAVSCNEANCSADLATSHNGVFGPEKDVAKIIKLLGLIKDEKDFKRQLYEIDCLRVASLPPLTFIIDGSYYSLHSLSYVRKKVDGVIFKSSTCYVAIHPNDSKNQWQLGTNFLSNYYSIFDVNKRQVAFAVRR